MSSNNWKPSSFEDQLLVKYLDANPGLLFLEVRVGGTDDALNARRIDGILVPDSKRKVFSAVEYNENDLKTAITGKTIHLIEAKRTLNRNVIGQVEVGNALFKRTFSPANIHNIALCSSGETDLEWYCKQNDIEVALFQIDSDSSHSKNARQHISSSSRIDIRNNPDKDRRNAFLSGWTDAVNGKLYQSARKRKTHANMGNLFGWIYGDQDYEFRIDTWDRYVDNMEQAD